MTTQPYPQIKSVLTFLIVVAWLLIAPSGLTANYDETKVPHYTLPALLKSSDGKPISSASDWMTIRRPEILSLFEEYVYGIAPPAPDSIAFRVEQVVTTALNGAATRKEVTVFFSEDRSGPQMRLLLFIPNHQNAPSPAILGLNFNGNHTVHSAPAITVPTSWVRNNRSLGITNNRASESSRGSAANRWDVDEMIRRGYALVTAYYGDIDPDFDDGFENGVHSLFHSKTDKPAANEWGSLATWAWGLSRALDYLTLDSAVDHDRVAVFGFSRLGKAALWAGAVDQRFALVISNNSGCGGAALSRREFGETVKVINTSFPHWFCDNFQSYNDQVQNLPVDQHMLIALSAPRPVYVASATEDRWADPKGEFLAAKLAAPTYALFGFEGITVANQPEPNQSTGDRVGYHLRNGKHDVTDFDWTQYLNFADRHLK